LELFPVLSSTHIIGSECTTKSITFWFFTTEQQASMGFTANYKSQQRVVEVTFKISNLALVELDLDSVS